MPIGTPGGAPYPRAKPGLERPQPALLALGETLPEASGLELQAASYLLPSPSQEGLRAQYQPQAPAWSQNWSRQENSIPEEAKE